MYPIQSWHKRLSEGAPSPTTSHSILPTVPSSSGLHRSSSGIQRYVMLQMFYCARYRFHFFFFINALIFEIALRAIFKENAMLWVTNHYLPKAYRAIICYWQNINFRLWFEPQNPFLYGWKYWLIPLVLSEEVIKGPKMGFKNVWIFKQLTLFIILLLKD